MPRWQGLRRRHPSHCQSINQDGGHGWAPAAPSAGGCASPFPATFVSDRGEPRALQALPVCLRQELGHLVLSQQDYGSCPMLVAQGAGSTGSPQPPRRPPVSEVQAGAAVEMLAAGAGGMGMRSPASITAAAVG